MQYTTEVASLMDTKCTMSIKFPAGSELHLSSDLLMHPDFQELFGLVEGCTCRVAWNESRILIDSLSKDQFPEFSERLESSSLFLEHCEKYADNYYFATLRWHDQGAPME